MRRNARTSAFQAIFSLDSSPQGPGLLEDGSLDRTLEMILSENQVKDKEALYLQSVLGLYLDHHETIDGRLSDFIKGKWSLVRLGRAERAILRLGALEILYLDDVPKKVAINEALELSKIFADQESKGLINGVLDKIDEKKDD